MFNCLPKMKPLVYMMNLVLISGLRLVSLVMLKDM